MIRRIARCLPLLLALAPALLPLWQILHFGVDVPYWDQFDDDLAGVHIKAHAGQLTLADLAAQHNEHRILIPRLCYLALDHITQGNVIAEMLAGWAIALATSLVFLHLLRRPRATVAPTPAPPPAAARPLGAWFLVNLLIFSPAQWENWLWGMGLANLLPMLWILLALVAAGSALRPAAKFALAVACAALATWSSGNGMLAWGLVGGILLWAPTRRELAAGWRSAVGLLAIMAVCIVPYFIGLAPSSHGGLHPYDSTLSAKFAYAVAFAGAPFGFAINAQPVLVATVAGVLIYALLAACVARFLQLWRRGDDVALCRQLLPWLGVAGFAVGSALIAAYARAGISVGQSLSSRYVSFALYMPVALVALVPALKPWRLFTRPGRDEHPAVARLSSLVPAVGATALILLSLAAVSPALQASEETRLARRQTRAAALLSTLLRDHPLITLRVSSESARAQRSAAGLDAIGYLRPRLFRSPEARRRVAPQPPPAERCGRLEQAWEIAPGEIALIGWAALPESAGTVDLVLLCAADERGEPLIVDMVPVGAPRPDKAAELGAASRSCGWMLRIPVARILRPAGPTTITAWALDGERGVLFPLAGTVDLGR